MFNWNLSGKMIEYLYNIDNKSNKCKIAYFRFYYGLIEFNIFKCGSGYRNPAWLLTKRGFIIKGFF